MLMNHRRIAVAVAMRYQRQCQGYTLIEVLLTAVIVLLAMTGMLTMQMMGIKVTQDAYNRTQATTLAYQMTDNLRANCANIGAYTGHTLCDASNRATNDTRTCEYAQDSDTSYTRADDPAVKHDFDEWWDAISASDLPPWYATIRTSTQTDGTTRHHIVIQWEDARIAEAEENISGTTSGTTPAATSCLAGETNSDVPIGMVEVCLTTIPCPLDT